MTLARQEPVEIEPMVTLPLEDPGVVIERATAWANHLMAVVEQRQMYKLISGKKYLMAEAWELIAAFDQAGYLPEQPIPITDGAEILGYTVRVNLVKHGETLSAGIMPCYFTDFPCRGKQGGDKHKAAMSAAQTWALSKAGRMRYAFVAKMAGYEPTPADEMDASHNAPPAQEEHRAAPPTQQRPGQCPLHLMRDSRAAGPKKKMGHPIPGSKPLQWCYADERAEPTLVDAADPENATAPIVERPEPTGEDSQEAIDAEYEAHLRGEARRVGQR